MRRSPRWAWSFRWNYVTDLAQIAAYGVMSLPALVINNRVAAAGKVLTTQEVTSLLAEQGFSSSAPCCSGCDTCKAEPRARSILILGSGCKNCQTLEANTRTALEQMGDHSSTVHHVTDFGEIAAYGVMSTPALVVDGKVASFGKVFAPDAIVALLTGKEG